MFYSLEFMPENTKRVSGRTIFTIKKNIADPLSWELIVYAYLNALNLCLASVVRELFVYGLSSWT